MDTHIDAMVQWTRDLCQSAFFTTPSVIPPFDFDFPDTVDEVAILADGAWLVPLQVPHCLEDFWTCFRKYVPKEDHANEAFKMIERKDAALATATEAVLFFQLAQWSPILKQRLRRITWETRLDLRIAELDLVNFQLHGGLLIVDTRSTDKLHYAATILHRIHLYIYTLMSAFLRAAPALLKKQFASIANEFKARHINLLSDTPRSFHTPKQLITVISNQLIFLSAYYKKSMDFWQMEHRYIWDVHEVHTLVTLHDMAIRALSAICTPTSGPNAVPR